MKEIRVKVSLIQKQPPEVSLEISQNLQKNTCTIVLSIYFSVGFAKFLRTPFYTKPILVAACVS